MNNNDSVAIIEALLAEYQQQHPWQDKPEHHTRRGLNTERFYCDAFTYNQDLSAWVQKQANERGICIYSYRISRTRRAEDDRLLCDVFFDGMITRTSVGVVEGYYYALLMMENTDLYYEAGMKAPITGDMLRKQQNAVERSFDDGIYTPQYSYGPGPLTSEKRDF